MTKKSSFSLFKHPASLKGPMILTSHELCPIHPQEWLWQCKCCPGQKSHHDGGTERLPTQPKYMMAPDCMGFSQSNNTAVRKIEKERWNYVKRSQTKTTCFKAPIQWSSDKLINKKMIIDYRSAMNKVVVFIFLDGHHFLQQTCWWVAGV